MALVTDRKGPWLIVKVLVATPVIPFWYCFFKVNPLTFYLFHNAITASLHRELIR